MLGDGCGGACVDESLQHGQRGCDIVDLFNVDRMGGCRENMMVLFGVDQLHDCGAHGLQWLLFFRYCHRVRWCVDQWFDCLLTALLLFGMLFGCMCLGCCVKC